jgi:membrane protein implicated in regulation of membrane protease activity
LQKIYIKNLTSGGNPLANILVLIVGAIIIGVSLVLGFFAFLALAAAVLIGAIVVSIRSWWLGRKAPPQAEPKAASGGEFIEGEFHVVKKDKTS